MVASVWETFDLGYTLVVPSIDLVASGSELVASTLGLAVAQDGIDSSIDSTADLLVSLPDGDEYIAVVSGSIAVSEWSHIPPGWADSHSWYRSYWA